MCNCKSAVHEGGLRFNCFCLCVCVCVSARACVYVLILGVRKVLSTKYLSTCSKGCHGKMVIREIAFKVAAVAAVAAK